MRLLGTILSLCLLGMVQSASAQDQAENSCQRLVNDGQCLCAIPKEWVPGQVGDLSQLVGNVLATGKAGYTPAQDGHIALFSGDNVVVPSNGSALLAFSQYCLKTLPGNSSVLITEKAECACAVLTTVRGIPFWIPAGGAVAAGGVVVVVTTLPGDESMSQ